jgi:hypothetical protein
MQVKHANSAARGNADDANAKCSVSVKKENAFPPTGINDPISQQIARADEKTGTSTRASLKGIMDASGELGKGLISNDSEQ